MEALSVPAGTASAPTEPAVRVAGLGVTHGDGTVALADVDLRVGAGEIVAVVGPSGCGKTTLLRVLAGLQVPTVGRIDRVADRLGMVFQEPALLAWRTVRANVELPAELSGLDRPERARRACGALDLVGLGEHAGRYPRALSGGQRSRVALARALSLTPDLLLLDEPFAALDELTRERLHEDVLALQRRGGYAVVVVTHAVAEAVFLADRVVVLTPGPGRVAAEVVVPFGRNRPATLRYEPTFAAVAAEVAAVLRRSAP